jgi:hypothetical protein
MAPSTPQHKRLTRDQRLQVQTLRLAGHTYEKITQLLDITQRQAQYAVLTERVLRSVPVVLRFLRMNKFKTLSSISVPHVLVGLCLIFT